MSPHVVVNITFWIAMILLVLSAYNFFFHGGMPATRTAPAIRRKIVEIVKADYDAHKGQPYTVVDLGSANGLFTRDLARAMPDARVIGVEINALSVAWSNLVKRSRAIRNVEYRKMDLFQYDFSETNAVVMFLLPYHMDVLGRRLTEQAPHGAIIAANKYGLGNGWKADEAIEVNTAVPLQGHVFIYRKA